MAKLDHLVKKLTAAGKPPLLQPYSPMKADLDSRGSLKWYFDFLALQPSDAQPEKWEIVLATPGGAVLLIHKPVLPAWEHRTSFHYCLYTSTLPLQDDKAPAATAAPSQPVMFCEGRVGITQLQDFDTCARRLILDTSSSPPPPA